MLPVKTFVMAEFLNVAIEIFENITQYVQKVYVTSFVSSEKAMY